MKKLKLAATSVLLLSLAACAPAITGSQSSVPIVASSVLAPVSIRAGQTLYVQYTYPAGYLEIPDARFDDVSINFDARDSGNDVKSPELNVGWLRLKVSGLPDGWNVTLAQATLVKEIVKTVNASTRTEVRYNDRVRVVYKITAPADAGKVELARLAFFDEAKPLGTATLLLGAGAAQPDAPEQPGQ